MIFYANSLKNKYFNNGENMDADRIVQPPPPYIAKPPPQEPVKSTPQLDSTIVNAASWLSEHDWTIIPEITSNPNSEPVRDIAVVVGHTGSDPARYKANELAIKRLQHANPRPKYFIFVEFINEGEESHYQSLEFSGWNKVIVVKNTYKGRNVWQKEAIWNVGAKYAFSLPGITKCMFIDADMAYHDNSWCYYVSQCLDKYEIIQSFESFYYANQPDCSRAFYGEYKVCVSTAWAAMHGLQMGSPGGSYACTKQFFENVLGGSWPCSSRGSGDACLWMFLKGLNHTKIFPMHCDFRLSDKAGAMTYADVGYAPLLAIHFNHGPLSNRMYGSRDYLLRKSNIYPGSDIAANENGVLEWTDSYEGEFMIRATDMLFSTNAAIQKQRRPVLAKEIKDITRDLRQEIYGKISNEYPLHIVTYADATISDCKIIRMRESIKRHCQTAYKFVVLSNRDIQNVSCTKFDELPIQRCSGIWKRMSVFNYECNENTSVLFIDPSVIIHKNFIINQCPDRHIYMARPFVLAKEFGHCNWDSSIMFFRNFKGLYEQYISDLNGGAYRNPEYQFLDPSDYINAYAHFNNYVCRNIFAQVDYAYDTQTYYSTGIKLSEFLLHDN